jgi:hypothetical protein
MTVLSFSGVNVVAVSDVTAPILSSPTATQTGQTTADGTVTTDEGNGTLYYLVSTNATENLATVKAGLSQAVSATGSQSVSVTGLTAATSYYLHYAHTDAAANDSNVVSSAQFTTASAVSSVVLSFTGVNVVAVRNQIASVSGFNLDSALTVNTDNAVDLAGASTITATLGGQSLTGITVVDSDTFTADAITGGLQIGAEHDLILTVDGLASNAYAVTLGNKAGHNTVTQTTPHAEAFYKDFSGVGPDLIGADDQIIAPVQTVDLHNLTVATNGLLTIDGAENDPDDQVFTWFYLDAQDGYARSPAQTFTVYNQVDTPNDLVVIDSIIPNRTSAVVNFSYPGADVTSYEYNIGGAWIACTSPLTIPSLTEDTLYTLNIRPKNINSVGTSTQTTFTTLSAVDTTPIIPIPSGRKGILNTTPTSTVYLGRDNEITWQLQVNGVAVPDNSITKAELYIPSVAFIDGVAVTYSTDDAQLSFETNNTVLKVELGHVATILPGRYTCKLTLFDGVDVEGLAWTEELITFKDWRV